MTAARKHGPSFPALESERQLCLPEPLWQGEAGAKLAAVRSYASQRGSLARTGSHPAGLDGIMGCNGYLRSFVRRTEAFVLVDPQAPGD